MQTAVQLVYPPRCLACGGLVDSDFGLCAECWRETPFIAGLVCDLCGTPLPGASDRAEHCDECLRIARPWAQGRAALLYEGTARRMVLALKHGDRQDIVAPAVRWMAMAARPILRPEMIVVPIPLHLRRLVARRYNQSALLARALAVSEGLEWSADALVRTAHTPKLDGRSRDDRFAMLDGVLRPHPRRGGVLRGREVLLVDDVMTTGATFAAAAEACHAAGATRVSVAAMARVAKDA
ncbi:double zinc ribbon domain-containing protein [Aestuariicoccus sp. MJ-SS9]|uniref:double zinc ribbon domain-containing protein n=1 Tax=Aestuariicoccus sp. MJ-SS9 TaxID=3079855 RepID=UPI00291087C8|nr:double zinc ribbon domain-containing protein [Aestuariicoccus sp. MJ-SS9]MDU8910872.1 double zinc ribbon domain-containing protein [Aestuariicoccus sp. MJ-SS9]